MESSDLKDFEDQLKGEVKKEETTNSDLKSFEAQLKGQSPTNDISQVANKLNQGNALNQIEPGGQMVKIKKNVVLSFLSDVTGCGHIRNIFPMIYLNSVFGKNQKMLAITSPLFIWQQDLLVRAKTLFFQRQMTPQHLEIITRYKSVQHKYKYKMIWDMDDFIWGHNELQGGTSDDGVPSYNFGSKNIDDSIKKTSVEIMKLMDQLTVSTQYLADYIKNDLKVDVPIKVVPNAIPAFFWGNLMKSEVTERIEKPRVIYTGSPTHYKNPRKDKSGKIVEEGMLGDFDNAWLEWVKKNVKENKIDFHCLGGLPYFFEDIKDKITLYKWVDSFRYHLIVKSIDAHFGIAPLVPNNFNYSKSDIKHIEYCAGGAVSIGTVFDNGKPSPYDNNFLKVKNTCTVEDIDKLFWDHCEPDKYNKILQKQYERLNQDGRFIESPQYINTLTSIL